MCALNVCANVGVGNDTAMRVDCYSKSSVVDEHFATVLARVRRVHKAHVLEHVIATDSHVAYMTATQ